MLQKGGMVAIAAGTVTAWWNEPESMLTGKGFWHARYISRFWARHPGYGIPETMSLVDMLFVIGRLASASEGGGKSDLTKLTAIEEKIKKVQDSINTLKQKIEALETKSKKPDGGGKKQATGKFGFRKENGELVDCYKCGGKGHYTKECPEVEEPEDG